MVADIDIDCADRNHVLQLIQHIPAMHNTNGDIKLHNSGIYVCDIPRDAVNGCAAMDYKTAEQRGYVKIDLLNMSVYKNIKDPAHYQAMLDRELPWSRLWQDPEWASQLVHVGNYVSLLQSMRPDSITRMAAFISVIRPGKAHLQNRAWSDVFASVWDRDDSRGYVFKKSHAISYAVLVALHMNLCDTLDQGD